MTNAPAAKTAKKAILAFLKESGGAATREVATLYAEYGRPRVHRQSADVPDDQRARAWASRHLSSLSRSELVAKRGKNWIIFPKPAARRKGKLVPPDVEAVISSSPFLSRTAADAVDGEVCLSSNLFQGVVEETMRNTLSQTEIA